MSNHASGEYLLEVRTEEIPARMLGPAMKQLGTRVFEDLMGRGLGPSEVETAYTPRRLVLVLRGLPESEPDRTEQVMGPPAKVAFDADGQPTKALEGFVRRTGVPADQMQRIETDRGEYVAAEQQIVGQATADVLAELVPRVLREISWAKTMKWASGDGPWVRPVHGLLSLLDGEVVPFRLFDVEAGRNTVGHPILSPEPFEVADAADYRSKLAERSIEIDPAARSRRLAEVMAQRAEEAGGRVVDDPALLTKLAAICEIPGVMDGGFDAQYLDLPREVLVASLRDHQSAFTVEAVEAGGSDEGTSDLLPRFLTVMDRPDDPGGRVRSGNEWVVAARLDDAKFFHGEDRKRTLADRGADLAHLTFHVKLGSYSDKTERVARLTGLICDELGWTEQAAPAIAAAGLLKTDLTTEMVQEFTDLQGVIGGIYAREDGHPDAVWQAIYDQYLPSSSDDPLPRGRVGKVVALADRLDTLAGIFGLGLIPTGSRDPFALRRAGQGVVRIALEGDLALDLDRAIVLASEGYAGVVDRSAEEILSDLRPFLDDRIRHVLGLHGYAYDEIEAALAAPASAGGLPDLKARVDAVHQVRGEPSFLAVVLAAKRIANIVKDQEAGAVDPGRFEEGAERDLFAAYDELRDGIVNAAAENDYVGALSKVAELAEVLDRFFDDVMVMAEDPAVRANRISLLMAIGEAISRTAKLTEVVVDKSEHRQRHGG